MAKIPSTKTSKFPKVIYDLLASTDYDARMTRFVGLGVQEQPEWQGQKKGPAFKCAITFELVGTDVTGKDEEGKAVDPRPACMFADFFLFPGAKRGKVFDLCQILEPGIESVPDNLEWFQKKLDSVLNLKVGTYKDKTGNIRNKTESLSPIPAKYQGAVVESRTDKVFFDPYEDTTEAFEAYSKVYKYQQEILANAIDKADIPFAGKEPAKQTPPTDKARTSGETDTAQSQNEEDDSPF